MNCNCRVACVGSFVCTTLGSVESGIGVNRGPYEGWFFCLPLSWSEVTLAGWAPGRDPSGRQTAGRGTRSCCPSQPTGHLTGPKACQTDTPPPPAGQEAERGQGRGPGEGCMEVEVGIGDNQYPMHLSISYSRVEVERTLRGVMATLHRGCLRWHRW